jgi:S-DNA-T family DNA segregation ATPase FtsK/SpoIIIE
LFQRAGAHLAFCLMLLSGVLLLTGASISGLARFVADGARAAVSRGHGLGRALSYERTGAGDELIGFEVEPYSDEEDEEDELDDQSIHEQDTLTDLDPLEIVSEEVESRSAPDGEPVVTARPTRARDGGEPDELTPMGERRSAVTESEGIRYRLPDPAFLRRSSAGGGPDTSNQEEVADLLVETLGHFGIDADVVGRVSGPRVTRYELSLAPGTKVSKVTQLKDDLAYGLASTDIRILAPIPGKQAVGVEVPNQSHRMVFLGDIFRRKLPNGAATKGATSGPSPLCVWLGKDIAGKAVWTDLARMPHVLVAGTTGAGKSGSINAMLSSILLRATPNEVRMVLVDPKRVELNYYEDIPHLLTPVVTVPRMAANVLNNLIAEMECRYEVMGEARARNIVELNRARTAAGEPPLPYILCVIDELADLMMVAPAEVEDAIIRLAQKSRAVGIHLVLATQRPSVDVITGMIKANVPSRIAFAVSSQTDSRVILDQAGAESLLGQGDMLFKPLGTSRLQRVQGAYVSEEEIALVVEQCRAQREQELDESMLDLPEAFEEDAPGDGDESFDPDEDPLLDKAIEIVVQTQTASVSLLQRRLRVGYTRAGRLIDMLERRQIISGYEGSKPRRVLIELDDLQRVVSQ